MLRLAPDAVSWTFAALQARANPIYFLQAEPCVSPERRAVGRHWGLDPFPTSPCVERHRALKPESGERFEPLAKLRRGSARFVASGDSASAILRDCSGIAWYSAASERFWVTSGKPMAALPRNGGKALMSCLGANALR